MEEGAIYKSAAEKITVFKALDFLTEECAELIVVIQHFKRSRIGMLDLLKEIVDVENMIGQAKEFESLYHPGTYTLIKEKELERLYNR